MGNIRRVIGRSGDPNVAETMLQVLVIKLLLSHMFDISSIVVWLSTPKSRVNLEQNSPFLMDNSNVLAVNTNRKRQYSSIVVGNSRWNRWNPCMSRTFSYDTWGKLELSKLATIWATIREFCSTVIRTWTDCVQDQYGWKFMRRAAEILKQFKNLVKHYYQKFIFMFYN